MPLAFTGRLRLAVGPGVEGAAVFDGWCLRLMSRPGCYKRCKERIQGGSHEGTLAFVCKMGRAHLAASGARKVNTY